MGSMGMEQAWRSVEEPQKPNGRRASTAFTFEPGKMGGRACIRGLRITVGLIVSLVAEGIAWEEILKDYPDLERDDIRQALGYAAWLTRQEIVSV
jgi:uncharacterized protein (DUF433 family)